MGSSYLTIIYEFYMRIMEREAGYTSYYVDQYGVIHAQILISVSWKFYRAFVCLFLDYQVVQLK